jgi:hypothetical protein
MASDWDRIFQCRQIALSQACHDFKGSALDEHVIRKARFYEDYLYGGYAYAMNAQSAGATPAPPMSVEEAVEATIDAS